MCPALEECGQQLWQKQTLNRLLLEAETMDTMHTNVDVLTKVNVSK